MCQKVVQDCILSPRDERSESKTQSLTTACKLALIFPKQIGSPMRACLAQGSNPGLIHLNVNG